jgi:UDP-N-acetylglucosamine 2-epimerase (non-hydrolysing)
MKQVLSVQAKAIEKSQVLKKLGLKKQKYFAVSLHREENVDDKAKFQRLLTALGELKIRYKVPVIVSTHPRTRKRLEALGKKAPKGLQFMAPLAFADYISLQRAALCVLSDSGSLTEEASLLGFAAVMLREAHERPEGQDQGTVIMAGIRGEGIAESVRVATERFARAGRTWRVAPDYDVDDVAAIVVNAILGYTDYINRTVWRK